MLQYVTPDMLRPLLKREHPEWNDDTLNRQAIFYIADIHEFLDPPLFCYLQTGEKKDFQFVKYSILQIMTMQPGKSYFGALLLMNEYIKDRALGESLILRRW